MRLRILKLSFRAERGICISGLCLLALLAAPRLAAQNPDTMLPEQSTAKARELLNGAIDALGGEAYLGVRDISRVGRLSQFGSNGDLVGFVEVYDFTKLPDKRRREYSKKRNVIDVFKDRKSTRLNSSHIQKSRMPSSA